MWGLGAWGGFEGLAGGAKAPSGKAGCVGGIAAAVCLVLTSGPGCPNPSPPPRPAAASMPPARTRWVSGGASERVAPHPGRTRVLGSSTPTQQGRAAAKCFHPLYTHIAYTVLRVMFFLCSLTIHAHFPFNTRTPSHTHTRTQTHTYTHARTQTLTHAYTYTHAHTHTQVRCTSTTTCSRCRCAPPCTTWQPYGSRRASCGSKPSWVRGGGQGGGGTGGGGGGGA